MQKGEIEHDEHFLHLPLCIQLYSICIVLFKETVLMFTNIVYNVPFYKVAVCGKCYANGKEQLLVELDKRVGRWIFKSVFILTFFYVISSLKTLNESILFYYNLSLPKRFVSISDFSPCALLHLSSDFVSMIGISKP